MNASSVNGLLMLLQPFAPDCERHGQQYWTDEEADESESQNATQYAEYDQQKRHASRI